MQSPEHEPSAEILSQSNAVSGSGDPDEVSVARDHAAMLHVLVRESEVVCFVARMALRAVPALRLAGDIRAADRGRRIVESSGGEIDACAEARRCRLTEVPVRYGYVPVEQS